MPRGVPNKPVQVPGDLPATPVVEAAAPAPVAVERAAPAGGLPHPDEIDPKTLKGPVMTSQGWLCPDESEKPQRR